MNAIHRRLGLAAAVLAACLLFGPPAFGAPASGEEGLGSLVRIVVTGLNYDYYAPWQSCGPRTTEVSGCVLPGNLLLTTALPLRNHIMVQVAKNGKRQQTPAEVVLKDYSSNLALLKVADPRFFNDRTPAQPARPERPDERCVIAGWDRAGRPRAYAARPLYTGLHRYSSHGVAIRHRMSTDLDSGGFGEPAFSGGKLVGIADGIDSREKVVDVIAVDSIARMLKDLEDGRYEGQPFFELAGSPLGGDANLRGSLGLAEGEGGVYVAAVPAGLGGGRVLRPGDVILKVDGHAIDDEGMYDSPGYGRIQFQEILSLRHSVGDTVPFQVLRAGRRISVAVTLPPASEECFLVNPLTTDSPPAYLVWGGLFFTELTGGYLRTWGEQWESLADRRLLYYYRHLELFPSPDRRRVVVLAKVFATEENAGYHAFANRVVAACDGQAVRDLVHLKEILAGGGGGAVSPKGSPPAAGIAEDADPRPGSASSRTGRPVDPGAPQYCRLELEGGATIVLERALAEAADRKVGQQYGVRRLTNLK
jgi:hypothetical protein